MPTDSYCEDDLVEFLSEALQERVLNTDRVIEPDTPLEDAGLDSLRLTQLLLEIEEEMGVWIDEQYLTPENLQDLRSLSRCLQVLLDES